MVAKFRKKGAAATVRKGLGRNVTVSDNVIGLRDVKLNITDKSAVVSGENFLLNFKHNKRKWNQE